MDAVSDQVKSNAELATQLQELTKLHNNPDIAKMFTEQITDLINRNKGLSTEENIKEYCEKILSILNNLVKY